MNTFLRLSIANDLGDLKRAVQEVDQFLSQHDVSPRLVQVIRLAIEEVVTNIIKYGYDDEESHHCDVTLALATPPTMTIEDDGRPFNPLTDAPAPMLEGPVEARAIGGLGLHLLRSLSLRLHYQRENGRNKLQIDFPNG